MRSVSTHAGPAQSRQRVELGAVHFEPPRLPIGSVSRIALVNRLRTEKAAVIELAAPAGYGKTALLSQWALRDPRGFAWLTVVPGDDSRHVLERLAQVPSEPSVVVLDDADQVSARQLGELIRAVRQWLPADGQVVVAGRRTPLAPLARLRAEGVLAELTTTDLKFSDRETRTLFHNLGVEVVPADAELLNSEADGWPAGLYLAGLALKTRRGRASRSVEGIRGAHYFIAEYFESEVLERLDDDTLHFAEGAALLERMGGPICDEVLDRDDSAELLKELGAQGAFLVPLDREHTWFRFHPLLRDLLRTRLEQHTHARFVELSRRAAAWFERAGNLPAAIEYFRQIGDQSEAARVLGATAPDVYGRGLLSEVEPCLGDLRDERVLAEHQPATIVGALAHALLGHSAEVERWVAAAERAHVEGPLVDGTAKSTTWAVLLRAALCWDGVERMGNDAAHALEKLGKSSPMFAFADLLLGVSQLLSGDLDAAELTLEDASELAAAADAPVVASIALAELSLLAQDDERWGLAEDRARRARDLALEFDHSGHTAAALAYVASARSALRNNNWVRAADDIRRVHDLLPRLTDALPWLAVQVRLELARAHLTLNDLGAADELSTEIETLLLARPYLGTLHAASCRLRDTVLKDQPNATAVRSLTAAELRLLPLLTTHLTFRQIAQRLYVSRNTIKTQAISVYRKLGASSRTEAIDRAIEVGLLRPEAKSVERVG